MEEVFRTAEVVAKSRDPERMPAAGQFREDLHYRLNVVPIFLPPLRERREGVPALVDHFARHYTEAAGRAVRFTPSAVALLAAQEWQGNVRELENTVERTVRHLSPGMPCSSSTPGPSPVTSAGIQRPPGRSVRYLLGNSSQPSRSVLIKESSWLIVTAAK